MAAPTSLLADGDQPVAGPGHRAAHEQEVALGVHSDHDQPELGEVPRSHVARHPLALDDPRWVGTGGDGARLAVPRVAVGLRPAVEVVAVDDALEAPALGDAADLHTVARGEDRHS